MAPVFQVYRFWGADGVWWRLVSPNGRGLARSATVLATVVAARASLDEVLAAADALDLGVRLTPDYRWHWTMRLDGRALVEGIGDQDRRVRCLEAGRKFRLLAPDAIVEGEVAVFRRAARTAHADGSERRALAAEGRDGG